MSSPTTHARRYPDEDCSLGRSCHHHPHVVDERADRIRRELRRGPTGLAWAVTALGVAALGAAIALVRHVSWAPPAVIAVGALNAVGGVIALIEEWEGAAVGLVLGVAIVVLALASARATRDRTGASPAASLNTPRWSHERHARRVGRQGHAHVECTAGHDVDEVRVCDSGG
jgi:hypothetical protein